MVLNAFLLLCHSNPQPVDCASSSLSFPSNLRLPDNFSDMSTKPFNLSSLFRPSSAPRSADSPDSGVSSAESMASLINYFCSATPVREEFRRKENFCKLCMQNIAKEKQRCQGPSRHVQQHHMDMPRFFCPQCKFTSRYDKGHITNHIRGYHKRVPLKGEIRTTTDPAYMEKFKEMRALCFGDSEENNSFTRNYGKRHNTTHKNWMHKGEPRVNNKPMCTEKFKEMRTRNMGASDEKQKIEVDSSRSLRRPLPFSVESILAMSS